MEYEQKKYLAQHLILSSTSPCLSQKLLQLTTVKAMWDDVKLNVTAKSLLHQINILNRLQTMKCSSSLDLETHLSEVKSHFEKMTQLREYLQVMNSPISDSTYSSQQNCSNVFNWWKDALILHEINSGKF
jgi:hypothetical protein